MSIFSIRLPDELERRLAREAEQSRVKRAELVREAIADYLRRRERERFMREFLAEAEAAYADPERREQARALAEEAVALDNEAIASASVTVR